MTENSKKIKNTKIKKYKLLSSLIRMNALLICIISLFLFLKSLRAVSEIYIADRTYPAGNGSLQSPFNSLIEGFSKISTLNETTFYFIILSNFLTVVDSDIDSKKSQLIVYDSNRYKLFYPVLNQKFDITVIPFKCYPYLLNDTEGCLDKITISLKTERAFFVISNELNFINIILDGIDLPLGPISDACYISSECCNVSSYSNSSLDPRCYLQSKLLNRTSLKFLDYSLFMIINEKSKLTLLNTEINNFYAINLTNSYGFMFWNDVSNSQNVSIIIDNSSINNCYFINGLIKGSYIAIVIKSSMIKTYNNCSIGELSTSKMNFIFDLTNSIIIMKNSQINQCSMLLTIKNAQLNISNSSFTDAFDMPVSLSGTSVFFYSDSSIIFFENVSIENNSLQKTIQKSFFYLKTNSFFSFKGSFFGNSLLNNNLIITALTKNEINISSSSLYNITGFTSNSYLFYAFTDNNILIENSSFILVNFAGGGIFNLGSNNALKIMNITMKSFTANLDVLSSGILCYFSDKNNISMYNSYIFDINITQGKGKGGLFNSIKSMNILNVTNSTFSNVYVYGIIQGGVIYAENSIVIFLNSCDFINILSNSLGGVLFIKSQGFVTIFSCFFNVSTANSGAILYALKSSVLILDEILSYNTLATDLGGIMALGSVNLSLSNSIFHNSVGYLGVGGMYFSSYIIIILFSNVYMNNMTSFFGPAGSIYLDSNIIANFTNLIIENSRTMQDFQPSGSIHIIKANFLIFMNCSFMNSYSLNDNGGVAFIGNENNVTFHQSFFFNASAFRMGGSFSLDSNNVLNFSQCEFHFGKSESGGSIYSTGYNLIFINLSRMTNNLGMFGGSIYSNLNDHFIFYHTVFEFNVADNGGDLYIFQSNNIEIENCNFTNSYAHSSGGSFFLYNLNTVRIVNALFSNISSLKEGGVFELFSLNNLTFIEIVALNISIVTEAGFIDLQYSNDVSFVNLYFEEFSSSSAGFLRAFQRNSIKFDKASFKNGVAFNGAGLFSIYSWNYISFNNATLYNITSFSVAGVILMDYQNNCHINDSNFSFISSSLKAGSFLINNENNIFIENSSFHSIQTSAFSGGLLYAKYSNQILLKKLKISSIKAEDSGGILYIQLLNTVSFIDSEVSSSSAGINGGGLIFAHLSNKILIENDNIFNISAKSAGGIFNLQSTNQLHVKNVKCERVGITKDYGGVLYLGQNNVFQSVNCSFKDIKFGNYAFFGIFVYAIESNRLSLENSSIESLNKSYANSILFVSSDRNTFFYKRIEINISFCLCLFYFTGSQLNFSSIYLKENIEVKVLFILENSTLNVDNSRFAMKIHYNFIISTSSNISFQDFSIDSFVNKTNKMNDIPSFFVFAPINQRILFNMVYCNILLKKGEILLKNSTNVSGFKIISGIFKLIECMIVGFLSNSSTDTINIENIDYLLVKKSIFLLNRGISKNGSVFHIVNDLNIIISRIKVERTNFMSNSAQNNGGCFYIITNKINSTNNNNSVYNFSRSNFQRNFANNGGCFYMTNSINLTLEYCNFNKNQAKTPMQLNSSTAKGGVLFLENENVLKIASISLKNNSFLNNKADIGGVVFHKGIIMLSNFSNKQIENKAKFYGDFSASEIQSLFFVDDILQELSDYKVYTKSFTNIISGMSYPTCLSYIAGKDSYSQLALMGDTNYISSITIKNSLNNPISLNFTSVFGFICLSGPFTRDSLPISTKKNYRISFENYYESSLLFLNIKYRSCIRGERLADNFSCVECLRGEYLFDSNSEQPLPYCLICSENKPFYCFGGNRLTPKPGYWRQNSRSLNFIECADYNCLGDPRNFLELSTEYNELYSMGLCAGGYRGILCNECADGFGKVGDDLCEDCKNFNYFGNILFFTLSKIIVSLFCIHFIFNMGLDLYEKDFTKKKNVMISSILKIWINHIEIMASILFFPINWSNIVKNSLKYLFLVSLKIGDSLPHECLKNTINSDKKLMFFKLILTVFYPFVLIFLNFFYILFLSRCKKSRNHTGFLFFYRTSKYPFVHCLPMICLSILLLCYSDIMKVCLEMIQFRNIGDSENPDYRLVADGSVVFDSSEYRFWFFRLDLPLIICYGIAFPVSIFTYLFYCYKTKDLFRQRILFYFSFFYYSYDSKYLFWEIIIVLRKAILVFIQLYSFSSTNYKDLYPMNSMLTVLLIAVGLQTYFKPYKQDFNELNQIEFGSLMSLVTTFYLGIFYSMPRVLEITTPFYYHYIFIICGGMINILFIIKVIYALIKQFKNKKNENAHTIKNDSNITFDSKTSMAKLIASKLDVLTNIERKSFKISKRSLKIMNEENNNDDNAEMKKRNCSETEEKNEMGISQSFFPTIKPLTIIMEQVSEEKIHKTFKESIAKKKNLSKKINKASLYKFLKNDIILNSSNKIIENNKKIEEELRKNQGDIEEKKNKMIYEFYEESDMQINAQFNPINHSKVFLDETPNFYDACLNNGKVFISDDFFELKSSCSLYGDVKSVIFVKFILIFTAFDLEIVDFEINIKRHEGN